MADAAGSRRSLAAVAVGSGLGSVMRFGTATLVMSDYGPGDLLATAVVNVVGSFVIACYAGVVGPGGCIRAGETAQQFVMGGLCGGYTTRSLFSLNTFLLVFGENWTFGVGYVVAVIGLSLSAAWIGHMTALTVNRRVNAGRAPPAGLGVPADCSGSGRLPPPVAAPTTGDGQPAPGVGPGSRVMPRLPDAPKQPHGGV